MYATHTQNSVTHTITQQVASIASPNTKKFVELGDQRGWDFFVLGQAPFPNEPARLGDWLIVPAHQDSSLIPPRAYERVQSIYAAGLRPKGFIVVHEAPKLLAPPPQQNQEKIRFGILQPKHKKILKYIGSALGVIGIATAAVFGVILLALAAIVIASALLVPAALIATLVVVDPILIAVTEDDYWIEIDRWES